MRTTALAAAAFVVIGLLGLGAWIGLAPDSEESPRPAGAPRTTTTVVPRESAGIPNAQPARRAPRTACLPRKDSKPSAEPEMGAKVPGRGLLWTHGRFATAAGEVDWKHVGIYLRRHLLSLRKFAKTLREQRDFLAAYVDTMDTRSPSKGEAAGVIMQIPPPPPTNGFYPTSGLIVSHPAYMINAWANALDAFGRPLSADQSARFSEIASLQIVEEYRRENDRIEWVLAFGIRLAESRHAYRERLEEVLDEEQRGFLCAEDCFEVLDLDPWGGAQCLREMVFHVNPGAEFDPLAMSYLEVLGPVAGYERAPMDTLYPAVLKRIREVPGVVIDVPDDPYLRAHLYDYATLRAAAQETLAMAKFALDEGLVLDEARFKFPGLVQRFILPAPRYPQ